MHQINTESNFKTRECPTYAFVLWFKKKIDKAGVDSNVLNTLLVLLHNWGGSQCEWVSLAGTVIHSGCFLLFHPNLIAYMRVSDMRIMCGCSLNCEFAWLISNGCGWCGAEYESYIFFWKIQMQICGAYPWLYFCIITFPKLGLYRVWIGVRCALVGDVEKRHFVIVRPLPFTNALPTSTSVACTVRRMEKNIYRKEKK